MNWKKTMEGNTVEEYVSNKTGMSLAQLTYIAPQYNIYRLHEVRDALFQAKQFGIPVQLISDYDDDDRKENAGKNERIPKRSR